LVLVSLFAGGCGDGSESVRPSDAPSHPARIQVDGDTTDWSGVPVLRRDSIGEANVEDLVSLRLAHDDAYLYVRIALGETVLLQEHNGLILRLDTDADPSTGAAPDGADVTWRFGDRAGTVAMPDTSRRIRHAAIGLTSLPTVASSTYEVALDRSARPGGQPWLASGDTVCVALTSRGDRVPRTGRACYHLGDTASLPDRSAMPLTRTPEALRVMSYNVLFDTLFTAPPRPAYTRILRAIDADVIAFQEIYDHDADATRREVANILAARDDPTWHAAKEGLDLVAVSRYPIVASHAIPGYEQYESAAFLIDTRDVLGTPLVLIAAHPPCCMGGDPPADLRRQRVVDGIASFIREMKAGTGPLNDDALRVDEGTPFMVVGDMNFVGSAQQPHTLSTGEIVHEAMYGPSVAPDWDGTPLLDTNPRFSHGPLHVTWVNPESSFPPGRLDYAYVSDSVLDVPRAFVLSTEAMPETALTAYGLKRTDTRTASDHLPVVVDVQPKP
jgi:endonuclease/exonuclease/phosphatase family metal-dependent hydrolase